ncbi:hypothetical protein [Methylobacterium sp. J-077]|uniref:hypothetical protein n=1 Tax=Methylobacterium sp. J-077 TaxID=2836656 RepID=UPI001FB8B88A|nr:hypothetical protein [Methylobacterium sp. J-077]MCJ2121597.1 hypothetical protein [Methylobacterium sp. J-077]
MASTLLKGSGCPKNLRSARTSLLGQGHQSWSNGQTEGQITRLKLVKRQMFGRAKLDLLEARLIGTQ